MDAVVYVEACWRLVVSFILLREWDRAEYWLEAAGRKERSVYMQKLCNAYWSSYMDWVKTADPELAKHPRFQTLVAMIPRAHVCT